MRRQESGVAKWDVEQHIHSAGQTGWPDRIHATLKRHGIKQVGYVADAGIARLIDLCERDDDVTEVALSSEAEGAGLMLGAALGGERAALMMQSSGVGNCINTFSILKNCAIPCVLLVSMRGGPADFNSWQVPMGTMTEPVLKLCGFEVVHLDREHDAEAVVDAACRTAFGGNVQVAVLLSQSMVDQTKPKGH
jgi:sulfopyruvate decarboxylase alpha subunit